MAAARLRVELQLNVPRRPNQSRALRPYSLKGLYAGDIGRHQVRQIELQEIGASASHEQLRDLRDAQSARQAHDTPIDFCVYADPAIHNSLLQRNTSAIHRWPR